MGNYHDLSQLLRGMTGAKILILDTNNIQFYYQHETVLPKCEIFAPYDLILIPGWVQNEFGHSEANSPLLHLGISQTPPISFQSTDVVIYNAVRAGLIQTEQIHTLRNHTQERSVIYLETFSDRDSAIHHHLVDIPSFISICSDHEKYKVIF